MASGMPWRTARKLGADGASGTEGNARARLARRLADDLRHRADLALFADPAPARWTDALLAETRFHLAGTMNAVEMAIRLEVSDGDIEVRLSGLPQPYCGPALERNIDLLTARTARSLQAARGAVRGAARPRRSGRCRPRGRIARRSRGRAVRPCAGGAGAGRAALDRPDAVRCADAPGPAGRDVLRSGLDGGGAAHSRPGAGEGAA